MERLPIRSTVDDSHKNVNIDQADRTRVLLVATELGTRCMEAALIRSAVMDFTFRRWCGCADVQVMRRKDETTAAKYGSDSQHSTCTTVLHSQAPREPLRAPREPKGLDYNSRNPALTCKSPGFPSEPEVAISTTSSLPDTRAPPASVRPVEHLLSRHRWERDTGSNLSIRFSASQRVSMGAEGKETINFLNRLIDSDPDFRFEHPTKRLVTPAAARAVCCL